MTALRDPQQAMEALKLANETRSCIAEFRREIASVPRHEGVLKVIEAIELHHADKLLGAAKVMSILVSIDRIGTEKAHKLMLVAQIFNYDKRLRELTGRQRKLLIDLLEHQGWRAS